MYWLEDSLYALTIFSEALSPVAKLGVGTIQIWMMFELAMFIRLGTFLDRDPATDVSSTTKILYKAEWVLVGFITTIFLGYVAYLIYIYLNPELFNGLEHLASILGYFFFAIFVLMGAVNVFLIAQMRYKNRALQQDNNIFIHEQRRLLLILFFFETSYLSRFIWDEWLISSKKRF